MEVSLQGQMLSLFYACLFGMLCGALYDLCRIARVLRGVSYGGHVVKCLVRLMPPALREKRPLCIGRWLLPVEDVLYSLSVGALFCVFLYWQTQGVFRLYLLVGAACGFVLYYGTVGRLVLAAAESIAFLLRVLGAYLLWAGKVPCRLLLRLLRAALRLLLWGCAPLYHRLAWARHLSEMEDMAALSCLQKATGTPPAEGKTPARRKNGSF